jgi:patatin-like phospholipase/acyl hydrolase
MTGDSRSKDASPAVQLSGGGRFQVLALDGGGAKALFSACVLARLEANLGVSVVETFDLIAGTSAGGVIALGLGAGMRPAEIVERYGDLTERVFPHSRQAWWRLVPRAWSPAYSGDVLREVLSEVFGSRLFGESTKRLIIPSWDVQQGKVHIFKTPHHPRLRRDGRISMVDVAMATTAAPTYFPAANVDGQRLIDGGVWAHNPSVVAIGEAVSMLGIPLEAIRVLNVGTVDQTISHPDRRGLDGWASWARSVAPLMTTASG